MKKILFVAAALMAGLTGCIVLSVSPYYTEKDLVTDSRILGSWIGGEGKNLKDRIEFKAQGEKAYLLSMEEDQVMKEKFSAHLFKLQNQLWLDLLVTEGYDVYAIPGHQILKVLQLDETSLKMASLKYEWVHELLEKQRDTIRHEIIREGNDKDNQSPRIVLTAPTAELQQFILKCLNTPEAWDETNVFKRN